MPRFICTGIGMWRMAAIAAAVALVTTALSVGPSTAEDSFSHCESADTKEALKECVARLLALRKSQEKGQEAYLELVAGCARQSTIEAIRACLEPLTGGKSETTQIPSSPVPQQPDDQKKWRVTETKSRMDGTPTVYVSVESDEPAVGRGGYRNSRVLLAIRCIENSTSVIVVTDFFLGNQVPVMYRIDQDRAVAQTWSSSSDNKALGLWSGATAIPFIKALFGRETLLLRFTPYNESHKEVSFSITGLEQQIAPLRAACKW